MLLSNSKFTFDKLFVCRQTLSRRPRWPPTFSLLLFPFFFFLSPSFLLSPPLPQLLLWFKTNFRITMDPNILRSKQVSATMFVFKFYFIYIHRSKIFMFYITHYELGLPVGFPVALVTFFFTKTTESFSAISGVWYGTKTLLFNDKVL